MTQINVERRQRAEKNELKKYSYCIHSYQDFNNRKLIYSYRADSKNFNFFRFTERHKRNKKS